MENLVFNNGIIRVKVNEYGDTISLDSNDLNIFNKFMNLYNNLSKLAEQANEEVKKLKKKYDSDTEELNMEMVQDYLILNIKYSEKIIPELDAIFGDNFVKKAFRENYELDNCFVPDEMALNELVKAMVPIMEKTYKERAKRNETKYSANKRGKHNKTKDELIAEYREKSDLNE